MLRLNGRPSPDDLAPFDLADRGLTLGDGLFETIAVFGGRPALLDAHLDRMVAAAAEIRLPIDRAILAREVAALCEAGGDMVIRLTVTRGAGARGLAIPAEARSTVIASSSAFPAGGAFTPIRLATVGVRRNPTSFLSRAKTLAYLDNVLAYDEARRAGADDALMLNTDGRAACTAMANLFALKDGTLATPPVSEGVLPGVVRRAVLDACRAFGLAAVERPISVGELAAADAVFATNSVRLVMPVTAIDGAATRSSAIVGRIAEAAAIAYGSS